MRSPIILRRVDTNMNKSTHCTIQILNKSYQIKCPAEEVARLQQAAQQLNEKLMDKKNQFKTLDNFHTLLLTALHVSHELLTCQHQQTQQKLHLSQLINSIEEKIS